MKAERPNLASGAPISLLDAIACAFGAVILMVLITPKGGNPEPPVPAGPDSRIEEVQDEVVRLVAQAKRLETLARRTRQEAKEAKAEANELDTKVEATMAQATQAARRRGAAEAAAKLLAEVGNQAPDLPPLEAGIPLDSEYVAFVIDTSGSMQPLMQDVLRQMDLVLQQYPALRGFQVMSDQGRYMYPESKGSWMPDSPAARRQALGRLRNWRAFSGSNPANGVVTAIGDLRRPGQPMAVFIVGDDYVAKSFNEFLQPVERVVRATGGAKGLRIHALGFSNRVHAIGTETPFSMLMRRVVNRYGGAFLGMPEPLQVRGNIPYLSLQLGPKSQSLRPLD